MSLSRMFCRSFTTSLQPNSSSIAGKSVKGLSTDLYKERNLKRVVEKFKKSSELYRFRTRTGVYEDVVRRLASAKRFGWIEEILEEQKKYNDISKEGFAIRLISLYGKSRMFEHAKKVFDELPERECQRTVLSFNALLGACVNSRKYELVDGLFKELPTKLSIEPDLVSYNTVIKAFCNMGALNSASSMLDVMEKKGVEPDLVTLNTLLNGFYVNGQFADGEKIWDLMQKKNLSPDIRSYNAKLCGLSKEKKTKEALELFEDMKAKEIKPDVFIFNALIKGFANEGNLEEVKRWYGKIEESDCTPVKTTFSVLIPFLCEKGDLELAFQLCDYIFERRLLVDKALLQLVVDELVKASRIEDAKKLAQLARTNSYCHYNLNLPSDK